MPGTHEIYSLPLDFFPSVGFQTTQCAFPMANMSPSLQFPCFLQAPLAIDKDAPPLAADGAAAEAGHDGLEPPRAGILALTVPRELQDLVVKGAGLQEHSRDCVVASHVSCLSPGGGAVCYIGGMAYSLASWPPRAP